MIQSDHAKLSNDKNYYKIYHNLFEYKKRKEKKK